MPVRERLLPAVRVLLPVLLLAGGCGASPGHVHTHAAHGTVRLPDRPRHSPTPSPRVPPAQRHPRWHVVALGDSVTTGARCACAAFPQLYARDLARARGARVTVQNLGQNGQDTTGLLTQLRSPGSPRREAVRRADIVLLTIGANDFGDHHDDVVADRCALERRDSCVDGELRRLRQNMRSLLATVEALREGSPTAVLVTGYWNVFEDGAVARNAFSRSGLRASRTLTFEADDVLRDAARRAGATFVGLYAPFHGPAARGDVTHLLAPDGDHPDAAGQALIAQRLLAAGLAGLVQG
ncbi:MAG TPA: SGNH/GDSL hydrolase family protein [Marmoricola sp.]|nr:SGNH/GDSL hydrolase family protein [Marmoricola sp.]